MNSTQVNPLKTNEERENWDTGLNQKHNAGGNTGHTWNRYYAISNTFPLIEEQWQPESVARQIEW